MKQEDNTLLAVVNRLRRDFEFCDSAGDNFTGIGYFISEDDWKTILKEWGISETPDIPN